MCVYDDGSRPYGSGLPIDQRRPLRLIAGEDVTLLIELVNPLGAPVLLGSGESLQWTARTLMAPAARPLLNKQSTADRNKYKIAIAAADTRAILPQRATHELWAIRGAGRVNLFPLSELVIGRSGLGVVPP